MNHKEIFESQQNPLNASWWIAFHHHQLSAAGAPGRNRLEAWANADVTDVVTLLRDDEMASWLPQVCQQLKIQWHHFPLSGRKLADPDDKKSLRAIVEWSEKLTGDSDPKRIVLHCAAGLHRTAVGLYLMLRNSGIEIKETQDYITQARALTGHELGRHSKKNGRLVDVAESAFKNITGT